MFIRLMQTKIADCCSRSVAVVEDTDEDRCYCIECWGEKLHEEDPEYIVRNKQ